VEVVEEEEVVGLCATGATGWDILPGSALKERGMREERGEAVEEEGAVIMEAVEDPSVTSAIGLDISPASVARRRTAATSAMAPGISPGTAARMKTPATTAMRLATS